MMNDSSTSYYISATADTATHLLNLEYRVDMLITILLWIVGVVSASVVIYLLYRFILRFF